MYQVPEQYYFRLHHPRPRFKNDVENVLVYMATNISDLGKLPKIEFKDKLNHIIRQYTGNGDKTEKTINNWRTEISSLFGLLIEKDGFTYSGSRARELTEDQDLIRFFKTFLFHFEYPGGHLKDNEIVKLCQIGVQFKPAKYILELLTEASIYEGREIILVSTVSFFIYIVRIIIKIVMSNHHIAAEYRQKAALTRFYQALTYSGDSIDKEERLIIINALFGRVETGLVKTDTSNDSDAIIALLSKSIK
ncbi:DUF6161 domain-containing protein [Streptococcus suis]|uniref:DUF6161 domain-containing protein n=1 Tax=Streptococcus suis TaxID=1307 RepID=UPI0025B1F84C|nr:DUF6161 domain-containing protein [Streptococcus suis]MDN2992470.1 DUF6161 domain-containing protein [Streptococcus suis]MDN3005958.1 DUF6161 domain-containing protein [Streptococcus suis]MDN3013788.1 DUF6161 domain-containing protein [Streptococcus suis]MDS1381669.1 DUF6161 domain-containing protein [Streptococcus suis]